MSHIEDSEVAYMLGDFSIVFGVDISNRPHGLEKIKKFSKF